MFRKAKKRKPLTLSIRDRSLSFTSFGARFIFICVGVGAAAVNTGSNLLYLVVAMMLTLVLVSGILSEQTLRGLTVTRRLPEEIYAGTPFTVRYRIRNDKRRITSFAVGVAGCYPHGARGGAAFALKVTPGAESDVSAIEEAQARGPWTLSGVELTTRFPFGLFRKARRYAKEEVRLVYPKLAPLDAELLDELARGLGDTPLPRAGRGPDIRSLREYQSHDEARLIHWRASARLSTLLAKEFESETRRVATVMLDNLLPENPDKDFGGRFESAVSLAASAVSHIMFDLDTPVALLTRDFYVEPGQGPEPFTRMMDTLAKVQPTTAEPPPGLLDHALDTGYSVLVVADGRVGWGGLSGRAGRVLDGGAA